MPRVHVVEESTASPERVMQAARDFSPRRADLWRDVDPEHLTPAAQAMQFGYNADYVGFMPLPRGSSTPDHGLLVVNHEFTNPELMFRAFDSLTSSPDES